MARKMRLSDRNVARLRVEKSEYTVCRTCGANQLI